MANRGLAEEPALYLYGITTPTRAKTARVVSPGIDGLHPVHSVECGKFICWVSAVDRNGFSSEINRNMENLEWLALHGVRHQQVVAEISARETVIPARFGTVFSTEQALLKNVQGRKAALEKVFQRISGADEWGVKVFAERKPAPQPPDEVRTGKEYLQHKAARLKRRPERDDSGLREFGAELSTIAADSAPSGKISGVQPDLLWQATFLVPRGRRKQWDQALQDFVKKWSGSRRIEVNGPWPPYSFVSDAE
ncbi:MAG TPA: GvpL/GvpF family gas vesicle protein [Candidatus Angelobacter sp.]